jgi:hypothetical protein
MANIVEGIPEWARAAVLKGFEKKKAKDPVKDYDPEKDKESDPETPEGKAKYKKEMIPKLKAARERLITPSNHRVGDIVAWKEGLKNGAHPGFNEFAIVTEVLATPMVLTEADPGSSHYHERLDIRILCFPHPEFGIEFYMDGRRFQKVEE